MNKNIIQRYWHAYGGLKALLSSPYFYASIIITAILFPSWTKLGWWDDVLSIMPNMLGFSLGGFALWMSIGSEKFRDFLAEQDKSCGKCKACKSNNKCTNDDPSAFTMINAMFLHFMILQVVATIMAMISKSYSGFIDLIGISTTDKTFVILCFASSYFIFIYALMSALELSIGLFRITTMYEHFVNEKIDDGEN